MSNASKALRQHFVSSGSKAALDRAFHLRNVGNGALISDTWQWEIEVRRQERKDSFRQDFEKLCGYHSSCTAIRGAYRLLWVMTEKVHCVTERRWTPHAHTHSAGSTATSHPQTNPNADRGILCTAGIRHNHSPACCCLLQPCWHSAVKLWGDGRTPAAGTVEHRLGGRQRGEGSAQCLQPVYGEWIAI